MEMKDTIFEDKEHPENNKIFEKKNEFKFLHSNFDLIQERLSGLNINKVISFDSLGLEWENWNLQKEVTLCVVPLSDCVDQDGKETKKYLKDNHGITIREKYYCIDLIDSEIKNDSGIVHYYPTRNLILVKANIFYDETIWNIFNRNIEQILFRQLNKEQFELHNEETVARIILREQWKIKIVNGIESAENDRENYANQLKSASEQYFNLVRTNEDNELNIKSLKNSINDVDLKIDEELQKIKKLPIIKEMKIHDKIYVSFGDVYLTGGVITGTKKERGCDVPIVQPKKVFIGNLTFAIGDGEIKIKNPQEVNGFNHPHATTTGICFGQVDLEVKKLLGQLRIADLIKLLYSWAHSYNEEDTHTKLQTFYDARQREEKLKEEVEKND